VAGHQIALSWHRGSRNHQQERSPSLGLSALSSPIWFGGRSVSKEYPFPVKKSYLKYLTIAAIICLLSLVLGNTQSKLQSQWTQQMSTEFQQRSKDARAKLSGSNYGSTAFENEKKSYPKAIDLRQILQCHQQLVDPRSVYKGRESFQLACANRDRTLVAI
jgi:hypothetical protein